MRATIVLDLEIESDDDTKELLEDIVEFDDRIIKGNAYDPSQKDSVPVAELMFGIHFIRHIHAVGGRTYGE